MAQPRIWRISASTGEWEEGHVVEGELLKGESVHVVELEPVLDLLEALRCGCIGDGFAGAQIAEAGALLQAHGRLTEEAS